MTSADHHKSSQSECGCIAHGKKREGGRGREGIKEGGGKIKSEIWRGLTARVSDWSSGFCEAVRCSVSSPRHAPDLRERERDRERGGG